MIGASYESDEIELRTEIDDLQSANKLLHGLIANRDAEIARLQELLRGVGANRYWEGRWRDADAEIAKLRAALETIAEHNDCCSDFPHNMNNLQRYARKALAKEGET